MIKESSNRYIEILETLYDTICEDLGNPEFTVPEKYKAK
jgi:hypothetical protein